MRNKMMGYIILLLVVVFPGFLYGAVPAGERAVLIALYDDTDGDNWTNNSGWKTPPLDADGFAMPGTEGSWKGITVEDDHVTSIDLEENGLTGSIPADLGYLDNLKWLRLYMNQLTGNIPKELGNLTDLLELYLGDNDLTGSIPPELGNLNNLEWLGIRTNRLTGSIPAALGNLSNLETLYLDNNELSGPIPTALGNLSNLETLYLDNNELSGSIPTSVMNLTKLGSPNVDIGYNCLYTFDPGLRVWLDTKDPDWESHQDQCNLTITITSPSGNISIYKGESVDINWDGTDPNETASVDISYDVDENCDNGNEKPIAAQQSVDGNWQWDISEVPLGTYYILGYIYDEEENSNYAYAAGSVTILPVPVILVTSPNGGESWEVGSARNITWTSSGNVGDVKIDYSTDNGAGWTTIITSMPNDGIYPWTVPGTISSNCKVRISGASEGGPSDESDSVFSIVAPIGINIISPNGGESWEVGSARNITWASADSVGEVKIDYSTDNGDSWTTIITSTPNDGIYPWPVPGTISSNCKVRISEASDGDPFDESDSVFSIVAPSEINVTSPNGGESWEVGSRHNITWTSSGNVGDVKIDYSTDNGTHWTTIIESMPDEGSYSWTVPDTISSNCKVRISEASDGNPFDESDSEFSIVIITHTLYVKSTPDTGVPITVRPKDNNGLTGGRTNFTRTYDLGTTVTLTAPVTQGNKNFLKWVVDGVDKEDPNVTIEITMGNDHSARAVYQAPTCTLTVQSSPDSGVKIEVNPNDIYDRGEGETEFFRTYDSGTPVTLTAPGTHNGKNFLKWVVDGVDKENSKLTVTVTMDGGHTAHAVYQSPTYTLDVSSKPSPGIDIKVSPVDNNNEADGKTPFTLTYNSGTEVTLTAPSQADGRNFTNWTVNGRDNNSRTITVIMVGNYTAEVFYENPNPPEISVSKSHLYFVYIEDSHIQPVETFTIFNSGGGTLNWTVTSRITEIDLKPAVGKNSGEVEVTYDAYGLSPGKFEGPIKVEAPDAPNTEVVTFLLWVKDQSAPPFGEFSTPMDGSTVSGSVPLTGWALGDTGIDRVEIYREDGEVQAYIGKAVLVEGARPDIEAGYPDYPMNYKAGWGYMLLTNFLPNGGNGEYRIYAVATDREGGTTTLGLKTITVDNANAVKPFGAIDTPSAGGTVSGSNYRNHAWVLTPGTNKIPEDGSTINVYIDGVSLGHPVYNVYRSDIAGSFPGYLNSNGAGGYFDIDTTTYANGIHTIFWMALDNAGNSDGIGSRYFSISNSQGARSTAQGTKFKHIAGESQVFDDIPVGVVKGFRRDAEPRYIYPRQNGKITVEITQSGRVEIRLMPVGTQQNPALQHELTPPVKWDGYQVVGNQLKPLPIGSTMDLQRGIFYWQPGAAFLGDYEFIFIKTKGNETTKTRVNVTIFPG